MGWAHSQTGEGLRAAFERWHRPKGCLATQRRVEAGHRGLDVTVSVHQYVSGTVLTCIIIQQSYVVVVVVVVFCSWMLSCLVAGSKCVTSTEEQREVWRVFDGDQVGEGC